MSNLTEVSQWEAGIYQIETTDPVLGGPTGISNTQPKQLANRTRFLLDRLRDSGMNYAADTGALNAYVANVPAAPTAWVDGAEYRFKAASTNTGAATFTPNSDPTTGIAAKPIYAGDNTALVGGEVVSGGSVAVRYVASLNAGNGGLVLLRSTGGVNRAGTPAVGDVSKSVATMEAVNAATDGMATVNVGGGSDVTLTPAQYGNAQLKLAGTPSVGINLVFPSTPGQWVVRNNQGGSQNITAKTPASGGATVVVPQGVTVILSSDGTDVVLASASGQASFRTVSITGVTGSTLTVSGGYTVGAILVEKNGGLLEPSDFTATNGSTIVLTTAAISADKFTVYAFSSFSIANAVQKTGDTMVGALVVPVATAANQAPQFSQVVGVVGSARNASMKVSDAASSTATFTASELIVETALGGLRYAIANFSGAINLAATGAGGMDFGSAPISGHAAIYAFLNTTSGATCVCAVNATGVTVPEVYGGSNAPAGYNASALVAVWPTDANGKLIIGNLEGRCVSIVAQSILNTAIQASSPTGFNVLLLPYNAKRAKGTMLVQSLAGGGIAATGNVTSDSSGIGEQQWSNAASTPYVMLPFDVQVVTPQTLFRVATVGSGTLLNTATLHEYQF